MWFFPAPVDRETGYGQALPAHFDALMKMLMFSMICACPENSLIYPAGYYFQTRGQRAAFDPLFVFRLGLGMLVDLL